MKRFYKGRYLVVLLVLLVGVISYLFYQGINEKNKAQLGVEVVMSLYDYRSLAEFDSNIEKFKGLVTSQVFERMTADNSDRILSVYLKFRAKPCSVNIIESSPNYVIYSLISESMEQERLFLMVFRTSWGKVSLIREGEIFAFATTSGWEVDVENWERDFEGLPYFGS